MSVLVLGICLFIAATIVHIVWWRIRRPLASGQVLIGLLVGITLAGWCATIGAAQLLSAAAQYLPGDELAWLQALILALALDATYAMTYPAIEVESPTFVIIEAIAQRGADGIKVDEFRNVLGDEVLVTPRLNDLLNEGLVALENGRYRPTNKGKRLVRIFVIWRTIHRAGLGG